MTWYPTKSRYPDTEQTSDWRILLMLSAGVGSYKYKLCKSFVWLGLYNLLPGKLASADLFGHTVQSENTRIRARQEEELADRSSAEVQLTLC